MIDRATFNIDDEYVLNIYSGGWKKYHIFKVKLWTDAEGYYEAYSDDGKTWCFGSQSCLKPIEETSIKGVANHLFYLNRNKHYIQRICMNCAGKSDKATDYEQLSYDTIEEIEHMGE